jgi:hypothetical protein
MELNHIVEWKQTSPGIWTRVPEGKTSSAKGSARKIASLLARQVPAETIRPPGKRRTLPAAHMDAPR